MAFPENRMSHSNYCYLCDEIHTGKCGEIETTQVGYCPKCGAFHDEKEKCVGIEKALALSEHDNLIIELREVRLKLEKNAWNAAIEAAVKVSDINSAANIRKLKR